MDGGAPLKAPHKLMIEDFVPSDTEKDYVFRSLVHYYAHRLVERYPLAFNSIKSSIKPNKPHQFETEMDEKSQEFTGNLYTKSESSTENLIGMMAYIQDKYVQYSVVITRQRKIRPMASIVNLMSKLRRTG